MMDRAQMWVEFAASALGGLLSMKDDAAPVVGETYVQTYARMSAEYADALLAEYDARWTAKLEE